MATESSLVCGEDCGGITWDYEIQQLTFGGGLWGALFGVGLALSVTAATSNVDSWRSGLELTCLRLNSSRFFLGLDFVLAVIQSIHFCVRTYTQTLTFIGFILEAIAAIYYLGFMLPFWGFAHCEGILSGFWWMFFDIAIPNSILIGAVVSLPVAEFEGKKTWFAPSWLAAIHLLRSWRKLLRANKVNVEMFRNQLIDSVVSTAFAVYLMAMMMLTFENLGEPEFMKSVSQEKWNTISSLYFILTSVATVGFGDLVPLTSLGRICTVFAIYMGLAWLATVAYRSLQILAVNQTGGGFFEPILHSKYIVVIGNPTGLMLRNFLAEIFHPDHAEDADDLHVSVILPHGHPGQDLVNEWLRQPENLRMLPRIHIFQGTALSDQDLPVGSAPGSAGLWRFLGCRRSARTDELSALPGLGVVVDFALSRADTGAPLEWKEVSSPLSFTSGAGEVPDVLDEAVAGMALGESKRLLAYGEPSNEADEVWEISGQKLPPCDVPLSLDVTLLEVEVKQDPRGVAVKTLKPGDGRTFAEAGDRVTVHYIGRLAANGKQFDSTHDRAFPFEFHVGVGKVIPGFDMGMMRLSEGEKALLTIPSALAYGPRGSGKIPPGADLIFEVHLVKVVRY
ncbi:unnamed protein product [Effrenium voratum]|uniref:peptidylprolyl isomerase n=1 Tax=Effrenium voratum TaxID=2562239 RepID=A0AA36HNJ2_9DINO|nr:unnamed protein product [Effrenium voratum]